MKLIGFITLSELYPKGADGIDWFHYIIKTRDVEAVNFNAASTASASTSILQFKY